MKNIAQYIITQGKKKKKIRNVVTSYCYNLHVTFKKSVNVFQEIFLVSSKAASYIFYIAQETDFAGLPSSCQPNFFYFYAEYVGLPLLVLLKAPVNDWLPLMTIFQQTVVYATGLFFYAGNSLVRCYYICI